MSPPAASPPGDGDDVRNLTRWIALGCAAVGLAATLCLVYVSVLAGVLVLVAGLVWLVLVVVLRAPGDGAPASPEEQYAALEAAWAQEVPASQEAMVRAYLEDPDAAVDAVVGGRRNLSREVARAFLADRVTG